MSGLRLTAPTGLAVITLLVNLFASALIYNTIGWFFLRGYNEVVNFLILPAILVLASLNLLIAGCLACVGRVRRSKAGRLVLVTLVTSAVLVGLSLFYASAVGRVLARNLWIDTPIADAAHYGDAEIVMRRVNDGDDPNTRHPVLGWTLLHAMAATNKVDAVELLLAKGADPNARKEFSLETPLLSAVRYRRDTAPVAKILFRFGADPRMRDRDGKTPIDLVDSVPDPERGDLRESMGFQREAPRETN